MLVAVTGAALFALTTAAPNTYVLKVQETIAGQVQPFSRDALPLAVRECNARLAKENPTIRLDGKFVVAVRRRNQTLVKMLNIPPDDVIALVAPVIFTAAIGGPRKGIMACKFDIKDRRLIYSRMDRIGMLGAYVPRQK